MGKSQDLSLFILAVQECSPLSTASVSTYLLKIGPKQKVWYLALHLGTNGLEDGHYDDTDFAVQGNFGIMIEPSDKTRIGLR